MKIKNSLTKKEINDIKALNSLCKIERIPNFDTSFYIDPKLSCFYLEYENNKLISFLSLFYSDTKEIEIVGITHPYFRGQGYFTKLLTEAKKVIPSNLLILYQIPSNYVNNEKLELNGYVYHHGEDELINKIAKNSSEDLLPLQKNDIDSVAKILADSFNSTVEEEINFLNHKLNDKTSTPLVLKEKEKVIGFIAISKTFDVKTSYLFAFCVDKKYRSMGYGKKIIRNLPFNPNGYVLGVDHNNEGAKRLYEKLGFSHLSSTKYYTKKNL